MPQPTNVHVNAALTNVSVAHIQMMDMFKARSIFPVLPVDHRTDDYFVLAPEQTGRDQMGLRSPGAKADTAGWEYTTATYNCKPRALRHDIPDQIRSDSDPAIILDRSTTEILTEAAMIREEVNWANSFLVDGVWDYSVNPTTWGAPSTGTPITDMRTAMRNVHLNSRRRPNTGVLTRDVWDMLQDHDDFLERIKYGQTAPGVATVELSDLAQILKLDRVFVLDAVQTTSAEGAATATEAFIGSECFWCGYVAPTPSLMTPSAGYTFSWRNFIGAEGGIRTKRYRVEEIASDVIEVESAWDQKAVATSCGGLIFDALT